MTLKQQMLADCATVFLNTDEHAVSATQYPGGAAPGVTQTVIIDFDKSSSGGRDGGGAHREMDKGQGVLTRGYLWISTTASPAPTVQDKWEIDGVTYGVEDVGSPLEGLRKVGIITWDGQYTTSPSTIRRGR